MRDLFATAVVRAWFCPIRSHRTVDWRGDVAHCTHGTCELTSEDTRPWLRDMADRIAKAEAEWDRFREEAAMRPARGGWDIDHEACRRREEALTAEVEHLQEEAAGTQGPYAMWWILKSAPAVCDGYTTGGVTVAGVGPLPEKIEHVRRLRRERPELGAWVLERVEQMHVRTVERDPVKVLGDWYPDLSTAEVEAIVAELAEPGTPTAPLPTDTQSPTVDHA